MPLENNDLSNPEVDGEIVISPDHPGTLGTEFTLVFQASEPLPELNNLDEKNPQVAMNCGAADILWELRSIEAATTEEKGARYTFAYEAKGPPHELPYQPCTLEIVRHRLCFLISIHLVC